ncbi:MAG: class I SAM-dependent methyltransferase [Vicinamibacterales bacterium]|nr:class I SAM-dependent methyltransferase [Vicinamibacterales bacterium]
MFAEEDLTRRRAERESADRIYNDALTALDAALPKVPELPHPPIPYDEHQVTPLNERWRTVGTSPEGAYTGWRRRLAAFVWEVLKPALERQESFNSALVDHVNRNVAVHRADREAIASTLGALRAELEKLEAFHTRLILFIQTITLYVDTKDRSEHIATLVNFFRSGLAVLSDELARRFDSTTALADALTDEHRRRWETMLVHEQRQLSSIDELRTNLASVQQTGSMLRRELERLLAAARPAAAPATAPAPPVTPNAGAQASAQSPVFNSEVNAYKYVGFENKFRGSETDIRERQLSYLDLFTGASDVLDLGCGRGEFLALLREHGVTARGLDINHEMVEACRARGLTVDEEDALVFLKRIPDSSLGGLVALQVVEHFPPPYLLQFLELAYQKLRPGAPIVLETLNPACWFAFFEAYIRDITHAWPLHPDTLKYLVVVSGFQDAEIRYSSPYPANAKLQPCPLPPGAANLGMRNLVQILNENVEKVNVLMFGYLDYAVVGRRG